ncbi:MAG: hypothetical protein JWQ38_1437 [Flavipsychrobacter sp.]|nr:hypothetical protein [Flavipsychrobacter sp.]
MHIKSFLPLCLLTLIAVQSHAQQQRTHGIKAYTITDTPATADIIFTAMPAKPAVATAAPAAVSAPAVKQAAPAAVVTAPQVKQATPTPASTIAAKQTTLPEATPVAAKQTPAGAQPALLATNTPAANGKKGYSHVPLAGEKSYFGEKNEYMNDFVRKYLEVHNKTLGSVQNNSIAPFSVIDDVLEKKNLPKELKYLAVIESALNHNAVSHAGAVGPWQLMSTTAKMMGLSVTRKQDDRRDWGKSTTAATKYLELLYSQLNDWLLVIAAYNSGPTPVQRAIQRTGSRNFWDIKEYLPRETQGHVLAFIATASIFENLSKFIDLGSIPVDYKFGKEEDLLSLPMPLATNAKDANGKAVAVVGSSTAAPVGVVKKSPFTEEELKNMAILRITQPIHLEFMATELGIDKKMLARWNADYELFTLGTYPTPFYNLRLPKDKVDLFLKHRDELTKKSKIIFANK